MHSAHPDKNSRPQYFAHMRDQWYKWIITETNNLLTSTQPLLRAIPQTFPPAWRTFGTSHTTNIQEESQPPNRRWAGRLESRRGKYAKLATSSNTSAPASRTTCESDKESATSTQRISAHACKVHSHSCTQVWMAETVDYSRVRAYARISAKQESAQ